MKFTARMTTLLRSVPTAVTVIFCLAVIVMNFLSRITLVSRTPGFWSLGLPFCLWTSSPSTMARGRETF